VWRLNAYCLIIMPELPEVETVMRGLSPVLVGRSIAGVELRRAGLRFPFPTGLAARLKGRQVVGLQRRAKYILVNLDDGHCLLVHLGMTGRFTVLGANARPHNLGEFYFEQGSAEAGSGPHDHVVFLLDNGVKVIYTDHRRFGIMDLLHQNEIAGHKLLKDIGVEPLGNEFSAEFLATRLRKKSAPLKAALLDQRIIAGLGNIYASEVLYRSRLSPKRKAGTLVRKNIHDPRLNDVVRHVRDVLNEAIAAGGSTLRDFSSTDGSEGAYQQRFSVYDRAGEKCQTPGCRGTIRRIVQSGRSTFYCPSCQK
jgi:formamidopyrimidine-DNA glycosylase